VSTSVPTSLAVLGSFVLRVGECDVVGLPRKTRALIAFLALRPGRRVSREVVADLFWGHTGTPQSRHSLRQTLVVLRKTAACDLIQSDADALWIEANAIDVDAVALEAGAAEGDAATLARIASRYRGALLEDLPAVSPGFDDFLAAERARLAGLMARTLRRLAEAQITAGDHAAAVESASRLVGMDTLDEAAHRLLIECLARSGRRAEALQQFETCARILRDELDVEPDVETVATAERIRARVVAAPEGESRPMGAALANEHTAARGGTPAEVAIAAHGGSPDAVALVALGGTPAEVVVTAQGRSPDPVALVARARGGTPAEAVVTAQGRSPVEVVVAAHGGSPDAVALVARGDASAEVAAATRDLTTPGAATIASHGGMPAEAAIAAHGGTPADEAAHGSLAADLAAAAAVARRPRWVRVGRVWAAAVFCLVAGTAGVFALLPQPAAPPGIVFAGFRDVGGVPVERNATAGFADLVADDLATGQHLRVLDGPRRDGGTAAEQRERARHLPGARYLLSGTAALDQNLMRVSASLSDARDNTELWSGHYDATLDAAPRIAEEIAISAARAVARDRDIVLDGAPSPAPDGARIALEMVALGHQIDYYTIGPSRSAREIYRRALRHDSDNAGVMAHLAHTYIVPVFSPRPGPADLAEGEAILTRAIQIDPTNVYVLFSLCQLRREQGRFADAIEACRRTLDVDPHYSGALRELGHDMLRTGEAARAIVYYQASIDAAPLVPYVHNALKGMGVASLALGRGDDAVAYLRKAEQADVMNADDEKLWLAAALEMNGGHDEASTVLARFVAAHPGIRINYGYLQMLRAPVYEDRRKQVLAALVNAGYRE
jgi:DNA-binding SARP family transcriptional activator/TolB-like protein/Tfp pilus assembly protein PilF